MSFMSQSLPDATPAERERFRLIKELGCVPCRMQGLGINPGEANHLLSAGRRRGHRFTVSECPYHHRGAVPAGMGERAAYGVFGPSRAKHPREFESRFGDDETLLKMQDDILRRHGSLRVGGRTVAC
ncbi:Ref family recombination enhancement nuclease [Nevskia sp.]|uniref:Ref family recombination enhancement nuclease n=1 Tax=Nevskia sp. TaxID=1929292 RepID=UPI0025ED32E5|nr:Ref family recombination enhancement nuclease [Nevskia sp.]